MWDLFFESAWKVTVAGIIFGAGLPALFAYGVRSSVLASDSGDQVGGLSPGAHRVVAVVSFCLVVLAVALGMLVIIASGLGKEVSFDNVFPTLHPKA